VREAKEEDRAALKKHHEDSWTGSGSAPDRFLTISFANARFDTEAVFSVRSFEADADFTNARFYYPPDFDAVTNASRIDFTGAHIGFVPPGKRLHWTYDGLIPVRLRAFRKSRKKQRTMISNAALYRRTQSRTWRLLASTSRRAEKGTRRTQEANRRYHTQKRMPGLNGGSRLGRATPTGLGSPLMECCSRSTASGSSLCSLLGTFQLRPQLRASLHMARFERALLLLALSRSPCAAHARGRFSQRGKI